MIQLVCPVCKSDIHVEYVDLSNETALCCRCQKDFDCKDWIESALVTPENLQHPPEGASYEQSPQGFKVVVSARSRRWLFFLPAACLWSALMAFTWWIMLHAPSGARLVLFLFHLPFDLMGGAFWYGALMPIFGKVAVEVDGDSGIIFKGIGPAGWTRRFNWQRVQKIRLSTYYVKNWNQEQITLEGDEIIQVARGVNHGHLRYMLIALRQNHRKR